MNRKYNLKNPVDMVRIIAREQFTFPGCYELIALMDDSVLLCSQCVRNNYKDIIYSTKHGNKDGWEVIGILNDSDLDGDACCDHCEKNFSEEEENEDEEKRL